MYSVHNHLLLTKAAPLYRFSRTTVLTVLRHDIPELGGFTKPSKSSTSLPRNSEPPQTRVRSATT